MPSKNLEKKEQSVKSRKGKFLNFFSKIKKSKLEKSFSKFARSFFNSFKKIILRRRKGIIIQLLIIAFVFLIVIYFAFLHQIIISSPLGSEKVKKAEKETEDVKELEYPNQFSLSEIDVEHIENKYEDDLIHISSWGCETNVQRRGTWCMSFEQKHWCGDGGTVCLPWQETPPKPDKPEIGLHGFDCDSCQWNLICPENYINCKGVCLYSWDCPDSSF